MTRNNHNSSSSSNSSNSNDYVPTVAAASNDPNIWNAMYERVGLPSPSSSYYSYSYFTPTVYPNFYSTAYYYAIHHLSYLLLIANIIIQI